MFAIPIPEGYSGDQQDANRTSMTHHSDAYVPDAVAPAPLSPPAPSSGDYDTRRRRLLALAGGVGAALLLGGTRRAAHADFLFDNRTPRTALRVADELFDLSLDYFGRVGSAVNIRAGGRDSNVVNIIRTQDGEVSELLKMTIRRLGFGDGGNALMPNAMSIAHARTYQFPAATFKSSASALTLGTTIKDTMVGALHGILPFFDNRELLETAAAIAGVQGRHAALLREAAGADPFPRAFEPALSLETVAQRLAPYGYTGGAPLP